MLKRVNYAWELTMGISLMFMWCDAFLFVVQIFYKAHFSWTTFIYYLTEKHIWQNLAAKICRR
jgi:hypothetical protein